MLDIADVNTIPGELLVRPRDFWNHRMALRRNWRHILVWLLIIVVASSLTPGVDPFSPLIPIVLGIAAYEFGRRLIAREIARRLAARQLPRS